MTFTRLALLLLIHALLMGCADEDYFQKDALAEAEKANFVNSSKDSAWVVAGRHYDRNGLHRLLWGSHNRKLWTTPVKVPVFDRHTVAGGLRIIKSGGGFQTSSFHMQDSAGRLYAFRSIDKDPVHVLSEFWQSSFVANIVRDQTSAANPYGMLVVPVLAEAVGVWHTNPRLFYVSSDDTTFGKFAPEVRGRMFMLEEKFKTPADIPSDRASVTGFVDSEDALRLRFSSNFYRFDQHAFAKARLLDLLLGDWDRHKGQWDWAMTVKGADTIFVPIPKDRDQVFLKIDDGIIPYLATSKIAARKFYSFGKKFRDVKALLINAEFVDKRLLHELPKEEWLRIARNMQAALTNEVIAEAVAKLPEAIQHETGRYLRESLQARRDQLHEAAEAMYLLLAKDLTIPGTDEKERFIVNRLRNGQTKVRVLRPSPALAPEVLLFERTFNPKETERIQLHGLAGDDEFIVAGFANDAIPLEIFGGIGEDKITDRSSVKSWKRLTKVYDTARGNEIVFGSEAKDCTTHDVRVHAYDREGN